MKKWMVLSVVLGGMSYANAQDNGTYQRIKQTEFERNKGMGHSLALQDKRVVIQSNWGDTILIKNKNTLGTQSGIPMYLINESKGVLSLSDVDNPAQKFYFQKVSK